MEDCPYCTYEDRGDEPEEPNPEPECPFHETVWPEYRSKYIAGKVKLCGKLCIMEKQEAEEWWESVEFFK